MTSLSEKLAALRASISTAPKIPEAQNENSPISSKQLPDSVGQPDNCDSSSAPETQSKEIPGTELQQKVKELQDALLSRHPRMPTLLREIHTTLREYPENVTLLSEEEICIIVNGLKVHRGTEFATALSKGSAGKGIKAKINQLGLDAF